MTRNRIVGAALLLALGAIAVIGCSPVPATSGAVQRIDRNALIILIAPPASNASAFAVENGARQMMARYETLRFESIALAGDQAAAMTQAAELARSKKPAAVCVWVTDENATGAAVKRLVDDGVAVVTIGRQLPTAPVFAHVERNPADACALLAGALDRIAGSGTSYLLLHAAGTSAWEQAAYLQFKLEARRSPGMTLLQERDATQSTDAAAAADALLDTFRHAAVFVSLDSSVFDDSRLLHRFGKTTRFATVNAAPRFWPSVRSGSCAALAGWIDGEAGTIAVEYAVRSLSDRRRTGALVHLKPELVLRADLDDFSQRYANAAGVTLDEVVKRSAGGSAP